MSGRLRTLRETSVIVSRTSFFIKCVTLVIVTIYVILQANNIGEQYRYPATGMMLTLWVIDGIMLLRERKAVAEATTPKQPQRATDVIDPITWTRTMVQLELLLFYTPLLLTVHLIANVFAN